MSAITPTQSNAQAAMLSFIGAVLPGILVVSGQDNRVPEPSVTSFIVMQPIRFERVATDIDSPEDVKFTGTIAGAVLTVTAVAFGAIAVGAFVFGIGVAPLTQITGLITGTGNVGTYMVSPAQTVATETLSTGAKTIEQHAILTIQLDFHTADLTASDMAQTVATTFRDEFGVDYFAALSPPLNGVIPLYADDPKMVPFINAEQQYERRWVLEAQVQMNQQVSVPQQYADIVTVVLKNVDATFPP